MAPKRKPTATPLPPPPPPPPASAKATAATRSSTRPATRSSVASSSARLVALPEAPAKKKAKTASGKGKTEAKEGGSSSSDRGSQSSKTIVIEHCKQCNSFKVRATAVKDGLEKTITGIKVLVNPKQPRRGCFEVREEGGEAYISLLDMKRPFTKMKELNMEEVIADIVKQINV